MNHTLFAAARELVERARRDGQSGRQADSDELDRLARALGAYLPDWYRSLLATVPLIGLELGVVASGLEVDDEISWLEWLDPGSIHSESLDLYPGIAVLEYGYLCVGRCAHGTGDQYFLKTSASDDPPLVQIAHDAGANADLILQNGVIEIATTLSGFFADAKTRLAGIEAELAHALERARTVMLVVKGQDGTEFSDDQILCDLHDLPEGLAARCILSFLAYDIWGSIITEMGG